MEFSFMEPADTACFVCKHVANHERPILYAAHEEKDGFWQFLCGEADHNDDSDYSVISLKQATELDETINELFEMPLGVGADRKTKTAKWEPFKLSS